MLSDEAIAILGTAVWRPDAERSYELLTGSFAWSDEMLREAARLSAGRNNWSFRAIHGVPRRSSSAIRTNNADQCGIRWPRNVRSGRACGRSGAARPSPSNSAARAGGSAHELLQWEREFQPKDADVRARND